MAEAAAGRVALLSIHPRFADAILEGSKRVELRRTPVAADTTHVLVYATAPVGAVVGWFAVAGVEIASQTAIWNTHRHHSGVSRREYRQYFAGAVRATAIRIHSAHRFPSALSLDEVPGVKRPPQSFQYLDGPSVLPLLASRPLSAAR